MKIPVPTFLPPWLPPVNTAVNTLGGRLMIVGGFVRDALMGYRPADLDIEVYGISDLSTLSSCLAQFGQVRMEGADFGVISLQVNPEIAQNHYLNRAEFALPRLESSTGPGHEDFAIVHRPDPTFKQAARRRDFTINAMGYDLNTGALLDPYMGQEDADRRILRAVSGQFLEDPLRVFRAVQFAARYGLSIGADVREYAQQMPITALTPSRVQRELCKLFLDSARPSYGLQWWDAMGIARYFPELNTLIHSPSDWEIIMEEVDYRVESKPDNGRSTKAALFFMMAPMFNAISTAEETNMKDRLYGPATGIAPSI